MLPHTLFADLDSWIIWISLLIWVKIMPNTVEKTKKESFIILSHLWNCTEINCWCSCICFLSENTDCCIDGRESTLTTVSLLLCSLCDERQEMLWLAGKCPFFFQTADKGVILGYCFCLPLPSARGVPDSLHCWKGTKISSPCFAWSWMN